MYKHILIATDGSDLARKGIDHGLEIGRLGAAKVSILTVVEPLRPHIAEAAFGAGVHDPYTAYEQQMDSSMKERLADIKRQVDEHDINAKLVYEIDASPAEAIVRFAKIHDCDLIVMTSHGRRGMEKILLGSQTSEVLVKTTIPVLVVR